MIFGGVAALSKRDKDTEQPILKGAHAVFLRRGTAGARMHEIAAEAGVNQALLHYYFRSKEQLAKAVFEWAASQLMPQVLRVLASSTSLEDKVKHVVELEIRHLSERPYLSGFVISEITHHPERAGELIAAATGRSRENLWRTVVLTLQKQLRGEAAAGRIRPIKAEQFVVNLMSLCIFPFAGRPMIMAMFQLDDAGFSKFIESRRRELASFFLGALRP
jgi:TetR/AcrR family transcriptional regulator